MQNQCGSYGEKVEKISVSRAAGFLLIALTSVDENLERMQPKIRDIHLCDVQFL